MCVFQQSMLRKIFDRHELVRQDVTQVMFLLFPFLIHLLHLIVESFLSWDMCSLGISGHLLSLWYRTASMCCCLTWIHAFFLSLILLELMLQCLFSISIQGCSRLYELWCQYGRILLWSVQILWRWCNILCLLIICD